LGDILVVRGERVEPQTAARFIQWQRFIQEAAQELDLSGR
jgi:hypothetical protein